MKGNLKCFKNRFCRRLGEVEEFLNCRLKRRCRPGLACNLRAWKKDICFCFKKCPK